MKAGVMQFTVMFLLAVSRDKALLNPRSRALEVA
jgi:hypothetical protein